jgi:phosphate/sulfate permease
VFDLLLLIVALIAAFAIGANNAAACVGAIVGSGIMREDKALLLAGIGMAMGILLEGWKMRPSVVGYMIKTNQASVMASLLISSLIVLIIVTFFAIPLSFSQALVGGAVGIGILAGTLNVKFAALVSVSWIYAPLLSIPLSAAIYVALRRALPKGIFRRAEVNAILVTTSSFYVSYVLGANTVGLLEGMSSASPSESGSALAFAALLGSFLAGRNVTKTVSEDIVGISPVASSGASFATALMVEIMTQLSIPVSVSQIGVTALFGPALTRRASIANRGRIARIIAVWAMAPIIGFVLAPCTYLLLPKSIS